MRLSVDHPAHACLLCFWSMLSWTTMYGWCSKFCVFVSRQAVGLAEADCSAIEWRKGGNENGTGGITRPGTW